MFDTFNLECAIEVTRCIGLNRLRPTFTLNSYNFIVCRSRSNIDAAIPCTTHYAHVPIVHCLKDIGYELFEKRRR